MDLLLKNITWHNGIEPTTGDVRIANDLITATAHQLVPQKKEQVVDFKNHFLYPGMINAHDHLEMNLYPAMGTPPYNNYAEWTTDTYKPLESPIQEIQKVTPEDRLLWGGIKNLISGVTTVVHHNPWHSSLSKSKFPVRVLKDYAWAHSLKHEKNIVEKFPKKLSTPFIVHAAEGKDADAFAEISKLHALGLLQSNTVLVHGIGLTDNDIHLLKSIQCALVWCPASNYFLFGTTAPIQKLKDEIKVALGSDSTMTGSPTILDEMRIAFKTNLANYRSIYEMVTHIPAKIFNLPDPKITTAQQADFFIAPMRTPDYFENLIALTPADIMLVAVNGEVRLLDSTVDLYSKNLIGNFSIRGQSKNITNDIVTLKMRIESRVGIKILEKNPLWTLLEI